jgi:hypothetical protein
MTPKDWTLLVIAAAQGEPLQPVHLQKALFLLGENLTNAQRKTVEFYEFQPYDFGPFAQQIYADADDLEAEGLILITRTRTRAYREYVATVAGLKRAEDLRSQLAEPVRDYLDRVVAWVRRLSFDQLVRWVYRKYPDMRVNSVFVE